MHDSGVSDLLNRIASHGCISSHSKSRDRNDDGDSGNEARGHHSVVRAMQSAEDCLHNPVHHPVHD